MTTRISAVLSVGLMQWAAVTSHLQCSWRNCIDFDKKAQVCVENGLQQRQEWQK
jgi:hypothetical protein